MCMLHINLIKFRHCDALIHRPFLGLLLGNRFNIKWRLTDLTNAILEKRHSQCDLLSRMGFSVLVRRPLCIAMPRKTVMTRWGREKNDHRFADNILKFFYLYKNCQSKIEISLKFQSQPSNYNMPLLFGIGTAQAIYHWPKQWWFILLMQIYITQHWSVKLHFSWDPFY